MSSKDACLPRCVLSIKLLMIVLCNAAAASTIVETSSWQDRAGNFYKDEGILGTNDELIRE
jgi:hypothetical protein